MKEALFKFNKELIIKCLSLSYEGLNNKKILKELNLPDTAYPMLCYHVRKSKGPQVKAKQDKIISKTIKLIETKTDVLQMLNEWNSRFLELYNKVDTNDKIRMIRDLNSANRNFVDMVKETNRGTEVNVNNLGISAEMMYRAKQEGIEL